MNDTLIRYKDLDSENLDKINFCTSDRTAVFQGFSKNDLYIKGKYGVGTLAGVGNIWGIITARHVWDSFKVDKIENVNFSIHQKHQLFLIKKEYLTPLYPENDDLDICFI